MVESEETNQKKVSDLNYIKYLERNINTKYSLTKKVHIFFVEKKTDGAKKLEFKVVVRIPHACLK